MSLDGGYTGSIDHAIANLHIGRRQGYDQGYDQGYEEGYQHGFKEGSIAGWNKSTIASNETMRKQLAYTHQHFTEKEQLKDELIKEREYIKQLEERLAGLERHNATMRGENSKLREMIGSLKEANKRLQEQVASLDAKNTERLSQHNHRAVFMNSVRMVIEELTRENTPQAGLVRQLFVEKYVKEVSEAIEDGHLKVSLETDPEFARSSPKAQKFIVDILHSARKQKDLTNREEELEEDWVP